MLLKEFEKKWLSVFAEGIDEEKILTYVFHCGNLIWHIFSQTLLPKKSYLKGNAARKAFNSLSKKERETALYIDAFGAEETFCLEWQEATAEKLDNYMEIYAVAADYSWTYIKTHEGDDCGPYFYRKKL